LITRHEKTSGERISHTVPARQVTAKVAFFLKEQADDYQVAISVALKRDGIKPIKSW
jgi:hypothetical protein